MALSNCVYFLTNWIRCYRLFCRLCWWFFTTTVNIFI